MAGETAASSAASDYSYIGKLISLTSKAEIRYEGNLIDISAENFTISLGNVRCFGTEGRRKDGPQVERDDGIFEYIKFRGSYIKDLHVIDSPSGQTNASIYDDPAIIRQSHNPQVTTSLASMPVGPRFITNHSAPTQYTGHPWPAFIGNITLHQSAGSLGSCVASSSLSTDTSGLTTFQGNVPIHQSAEILGSWVASSPLSTDTSGLTAFQGNVPLHQSAGSLGSWIASSPLSTDTSGLSTCQGNAHLDESVGSLDAWIPSSPLSTDTSELTAFQGNVPLHQSLKSLDACVTSSSLSTDISGLSTSMCWPSFHGYQNIFQPYQQAMPQHPLSLSISSMQLMMQYPELTGLSTGNSGLQPSESPESSSLSLPPNKYGYMNFHSYMPSAPSSTLVPEPSTILVPAMSSAQSLATAKLGTIASSLLVSPFTNNSISEFSIPLLVSDESKLPSTSFSATSSTSGSLPLAVERSSFLWNDPLTPSLVTPSQLFRPEHSSASPSVALPSRPSTMVNEISSLDCKAPTYAAHEPLSPLQSDSKLIKASSSTYHGSSRGGRRQERKNETSNTEEFDFMAMNEKFNKDEIWGELSSRNRDKSMEGKNKTVQPNYLKDNFFDSLSDGWSKVPGHQKKDYETSDEAERSEAGREVGPTIGGRSQVRRWGRHYMCSLRARGRGQGGGHGT